MSKNIIPSTLHVVQAEHSQADLKEELAAPDPDRSVASEILSRNIIEKGGTARENPRRNH